LAEIVEKNGGWERENGEMLVVLFDNTINFVEVCRGLAENNQLENNHQN
jgi:hypothetical protein